MTDTRATRTSRFIAGSAAAALAAALCSPVAFAQTASTTAASGPLTRAEVKADTKKAAAAGQLTPKGDAYIPVVPAPSTSTTSRQAVKSEATSANKSGQLNNIGQTYGMPKPGERGASTGVNSRADVKQELATGRANGTLPSTNNPTYPDKVGSAAGTGKKPSTN